MTEQAQPDYCNAVPQPGRSYWVSGAQARSAHVAASAAAWASADGSAREFLACTEECFEALASGAE